MTAAPSEEDARSSPILLVGSPEEMIETLQQRRARWQMSYIVVPEDAIDTMAPIVARLTDT
jgi:hypothetical protein